jgi:hypothetical protein
MSFVPERRRSRRHYSAIRAKRAEQSILDRAPPDSDGATGHAFRPGATTKTAAFRRTSPRARRAIRHREPSDTASKASRAINTANSGKIDR